MQERTLKIFVSDSLGDQIGELQYEGTQVLIFSPYVAEFLNPALAWPSIMARAPGLIMSILKANLMQLT